MKRFLITSSKFEGHVEVMYNDGIFVRIDFMDAKMDASGIAWFLRGMPVLEQGLQELVNTTKTLVIVQDDVIVTLDDFKRDYPYSRNMHLLDPIWEKMCKADQVMAVHACKPYRRFCERQKKKGFDYTPKIAAAWLKAKEYLNNWDKL